MGEGARGERPSVRLLRVVVTGSECTGKTTLAAFLAERYRTAWSAEFVRAYLDRKGAPLDASDVDAIARGQIAAEDEAALRARRLVVMDTDLVSTLVYSRHYYGSCPGWVERAAGERLGDLYLLLRPDVPWVADGLQRDRVEKREQMHALFREALLSLGTRHVEIAGTWRERRERAAREVDALLAREASGV
jgi:NadR type nicotinamide-nucleotide adenylyltransferase